MAPLAFSPLSGCQYTIVLHKYRVRAEKTVNRPLFDPHETRISLINPVDVARYYMSCCCFQSLAFFALKKLHQTQNLYVAPEVHKVICSSSRLAYYVF